MGKNSKRPEPAEGESLSLDSSAPKVPPPPTPDDVLDAGEAKDAELAAEKHAATIEAEPHASFPAHGEETDLVVIEVEPLVPTPDFDEVARVQRQADIDAELAAEKHAATIEADKALAKEARECTKCNADRPCSAKHYAAAGFNPEEYSKLYGDRKASAHAKLKKIGATRAHYTVCEVQGHAAVVTAEGTFKPGDVAEFANSDIASLPEALIPVT